MAIRDRWCTALDCYTGASFSSSFDSFDNALRFAVDDHVVEVYISKTSEISFAGQYTQQVVVNCPEGYDGVVFQFAPMSGGEIVGSLFFADRASSYTVQVLSFPEDMSTLSLCVGDALKAVAQ